MNIAAFEQMRKRLADVARVQRRPIFGHFELSARCNLDCKMCYVHTQDHAAALRKELSTEQWKRIFDEAYECEMMYATLSGGECLIRKDFKELYLHLWNKQVYVTVLTNGTMLDAEYVEFFKTYRPYMIQISLYGSSEEGYLQLAGHKGFEKATAAIRALQQAGLNVRVVVTASKFMLDDYVKTVQYCKEQGFPLALADILLVPNRDDPGKDDYYLTGEETFRLMKERAELFGSLVPVENTPEPCGCGTDVPHGMRCNAGNCLATVTWQGRMHPCANIMIGEGAPVLELGYAQAWEQTKAAADTVAQGMECEGCAYAELCPKCPICRLEDLHSGHCRQEVCQLTRNLVTAGIKKLGEVRESYE